MPKDESTQDWLTPPVQEIFNDPRFKHLMSFADNNNRGPLGEDYDRALTLQVMAALNQLRSTEKQGRTMGRATWALVWATVDLFVATIVLVVVTVTNGG